MRRHSLVILISLSTLISACQLSPINDTGKIDDLLALVEQRLNLADDVAKSKWNLGKAIDDPEREEQILDNVAKQATLVRQCDAELVRDFFEDQMEAGKIIQQNLFTEWKNKYSAEYKFADAHNLASEIRPQLDKLTPKLITVFCDVQNTILQQPIRHYVQRKAPDLIHDDAVRRQALNLFQTE